MARVLFTALTCLLGETALDCPAEDQQHGGQAAGGAPKALWNEGGGVGWVRVWWVDFC